MPARILPYRISLFTLLREIHYTLSQMLHEPLAAAHVPAFQELRDEWQTVLIEEIAILGELSGAQAAVNKADSKLDAFSGRCSRAVDDQTSGATRKQLRNSLFKGKALTKFRRPVLAGQLADMTDWSSTLQSCGVPALIALASEAGILVEAGSGAQKTRQAAQQRNRTFRDIGTRKQFIDKVNAVRKETYGALAKLPFQNPTLSSDFADTFFYSEPPRDEEETIDEVRTAIEELEAQLAERRAQLAKLEEEEAAQAKAAQERALQAQAADDLEAQAQELLARAAALRKGR